MGTAWRKAMRHRVTVKRNTTSRSPSGASKFVYAVVATNVACSLQDRGGRMMMSDEGQVPNRTKSALFGEEAMNLLQQNDLIVLENVDPGETYKIYHLHNVPDPNAPHVEASVEQWAPEPGSQ